MFKDNVQQRLTLFEVGQGKNVECSDEIFHLTEKGEGQADVEVSLSNPCILFRDLENRKLKYFKNNKCADYVLFEYQGQNWIVHIFELKKTVKTKEWEHIKQQFSGALQNALALAGVLDFLGELKLSHRKVKLQIDNGKAKTVLGTEAMNLQKRGSRNLIVVEGTVLLSRCWGQKVRPFELTVTIMKDI